MAQIPNRHQPVRAFEDYSDAHYDDGAYVGGAHCYMGLTKREEAAIAFGAALLAAGQPISEAMPKGLLAADALFDVLEKKP